MGRTYSTYEWRCEITKTNFMELSPSWEVASFAATQELPSNLWNPEGSSPWSQEPTTGPYPEPDRSRWRHKGKEEFWGDFCRWEINIKMDFRGLGREGVDWIQLAQKRIQCRDFLVSLQHERRVKSGVTDWSFPLHYFDVFFQDLQLQEPVSSSEHFGTHDCA
jgi:hypothetical protein